MDNLVRIRVEIVGRVQAVGFRYSTLIKARSLNLTGWVKNRSDGSVSLEAQGNSGAVSELLAWCHSGPERSVVESADYQYMDTIEESGFRIT
jgi:acylphosphatase